MLNIYEYINYLKQQGCVFFGRYYVIASDKGDISHKRHDYDGYEFSNLMDDIPGSSTEYYHTLIWFNGKLRHIRFASGTQRWSNELKAISCDAVLHRPIGLEETLKNNRNAIECELADYYPYAEPLPDDLSSSFDKKEKAIFENDYLDVDNEEILAEAKTYYYNDCVKSWTKLEDNKHDEMKNKSHYDGK
jgi:hypothetical protein